MKRITIHKSLRRCSGARQACLAAVLVLAALCWVRTSAAGTWQGKEIQRDGVKVMTNPAKPMEEPKTAKLQELWRIGGETDNEDEFFGVIADIQTGKDGNLYVLDVQLAEVKIFSPTGEFIRTIGREGEGPGEFRYPTGMFFTNDSKVGVMQVQPGKIVLLTPTGEPAGEHPIPKGPDGGFLQLVGGAAGGGNLVLAAAVNAFSEGRFDQTRYLAAINSTGEETARYCEDKRSIEMANAVLDDVQWDTFDRRWVVGTDGRVYAAVTYPDYRVHVWNPDGSVLHVVERAYTHRKRTSEEKEIVTNMMNIFARRIPNCTVRITEFTKDVESIFVRDDGSLWVLSSDGSRGLPEGVLGIFDVFDRTGRFVRQVTLQGEGDPMTDGYHFVGDRLYVVTDLLQAAVSLQAGGESFALGDEEPEPMAVICYKIDGQFVTTSN